MFLHFFKFFRARIVCPAISGCHISGQYFWLMPVLLTIEYRTTTFPKAKKLMAGCGAHCHRRRLLKDCPRAAGVFAMVARRQKPLCSISLFYKCFSEKLYTLIFITFFSQTPLTYGKPAAIMARKARRASCSEKQQPDKRQAETRVSYPFFLEKGGVQHGASERENQAHLF